MTWFRDLDVPEMFGFLYNQVTPFSITVSDGEALYAWHVLPLELYREHEASLIDEPSGFVSNITSSLAFKLLRDDPEARLVLHFHGAGGTVGSGYRPPNYRALSAGQPRKIHVLTFDYRGFGRSKGAPSESSMIRDALAVVHWAMNVAGIPPSRILVFGQSLGTAVSIAVSEHFALQSPPVLFAGTVLVAPFVDVMSLMATYRVAGAIPLVSPLADYDPRRGRLDISWHHTPKLFWHAVNATIPAGITYHELEEMKDERKKDLGAAGSFMEWRTENGVIREEILKHGLHDVIMGYPIISLAVMRIFTAADPSFR
ncbi:Monoacylglycerol lipase ABHD12 [Lachnellula cervina]|uniref:Monoacylglycerol lipase ABHD12 n=1 Tax=Lachnellula cervina TaxID=1316786 RepID=A0A7D8YG90_9HELO|nr:Monoacylglycerol lipase ABHD12 [Lachnellula cervina]